MSANPIKEGDRIHHPKFGYGIVSAANDWKVEAIFENGGFKKVMATYVSLAPYTTNEKAKNLTRRFFVDDQASDWWMPWFASLVLGPVILQFAVLGSVLLLAIIGYDVDVRHVNTMDRFGNEGSEIWVPWWSNIISVLIVRSVLLFRKPL
jgi:hypothetical protein